MKDFIVDEAQLDVATSLGADAVLLIVAALPDAELARLHQAARARGLAVLVEAHDEAEIGRALRVAPEILGVNARDLSSFAVNLGAVEALGGRIPEGVLGVAESGVRTTQDLVSLGAAGYGAFLVGETLLKSDDPAKALRYLRGRGTTEVKICGVTREEDVDTCLENGVDWIGLVFAPGSPRRVTEERGRRLRTRAKGEGGARQGGDGSRDHPSGAVKGVVAVFGEETPKAEFERIVECVRPDVVQMPLPALSPFERPFSPDIALWSTVRVGRDDLLSAVEGPGDALHFDTAEGGLGGGTGRTFDWNVLASLRLRRPFVVAGGLTPANVASAIRAVSPFAVDVASGVESSPGVKDPSKIAAFVEEAGRA